MIDIDGSIVAKFGLHSKDKMCGQKIIMEIGREDMALVRIKKGGALYDRRSQKTNYYQTL